MPVGINTDLVAFQPSIVEKKVNSFTASLVQSIVTVILVLLIFLGLRTGLIIADNDTYNYFYYFLNNVNF